VEIEEDGHERENKDARKDLLDTQNGACVHIKQFLPFG
jgi:hypothetical protein